MSVTSQREVTARLARLTAGRIRAGEQLVAATRTAGAGAVLLIGSLAARGGDAFSDLNLLIVAGPGYRGIDVMGLFGAQGLAQVTAQLAAAPHGGTTTSVCLDVADAVLWLDLVQLPAATAAVPADSLIVYANLELPYSPLPYRRLLDHHGRPATPIRPPAAATELRRIADAAKHLARGNQRSISAEIPETIGLQLGQIRPLLHQRLAAIDQPELVRAIASTAALIDLADLARTSMLTRTTRTTTTRDRKSDT